MSLSENRNAKLYLEGFSKVHSKGVYNDTGDGRTHANQLRVVVSQHYFQGFDTS